MQSLLRVRQGKIWDRRGESSVTTEVDIGVMQLQAKEPRKGEDQILPQSLWKCHADTLILDHWY